jgi:hypothetical protein
MRERFGIFWKFEFSPILRMAETECVRNLVSNAFGRQGLANASGFGGLPTPFHLDD